MKTGHRFGFTLVELLVVIAIISVFIAMMLPAVNASRETARRAECSHQLARLIVGVQNYQQAHEYFPPGVIDDHGPIHNTAQGKHQNWFIQLLPYVDELPKFKHIDQSDSVYADSNAAARQLNVLLLECPSDDNTRSPVGISNYAGCHHDVEAAIDADNHGVFFLNSRLRNEDISDGPSHTIFIGEKLGEPNDLGWMSGTRATLRNTGTPLNADLHAIMFSDGNTDNPNAAAGASGAGSAAAMDKTLYVGGFSSRHPTGANFAFGDGSIRFVPESINDKVLQQLGNRADGELLDAPY